MQFSCSRVPGLCSLAALALAFFFAHAVSHAGSVTSDGPDLVIKTKGGLEVRTADKKYSFKVSGNIQLDYTEFDGIFNRADEGETGSDFDFRRIRISLSGNVAPDWKYKFEYDFQSEKVTDVFFDYTGFGKMAKVSTGKIKAPFGMDELTSSKETLAIERNALNQAFAPSRLSGVALSGYNDFYQYTAGLYKGGTGDNDEIDWLLGARFSFTPVRRDDMVVHIGGAWIQSDAGEGQITVTNSMNAASTVSGGSRVDFTPEVHGGAEKFASPPVAWDSSDGLSLEIAGVMGPLFWQFEYHDMSFEGDSLPTNREDPNNAGEYISGGPALDTGIDIDGYSAQVAWVLTGETRPYKGGKGVFGGIKPKEPGGAWEVFVRYTDIDMGDADDVLRDHLKNTSGFEDAQTTTVGLNWYVNSQVRAAFNFVSGEAGARDNLDDDGDAIIARLQYGF